MVFLAITRSGYEEFARIDASGVSLWVGAGVLSADELSSLRADGLDVSDFNFEIRREDSLAIEGAVATIQEHHPGEVVWVQA